MQAEQLWNDFTALPEDAQKQVTDLITFLRQSTNKIKPMLQAERISLKEEPFVGMWKNRDDLKDSTEWVRNLRESEWTR